MKQKMYNVNPPKEESNVVFHMDKLEATLKNKPYIVSASRAGSYSKLEKAEKREEKKLKRELKDYTR